MEAMTFRSVATVLTDRCRLDGRGLDALLSENTRLAKRKLETGRLKVVDLVSREGRWGWDGACLETVSAIAHDPIAADINLYRYCRDNPANATDPSGLADTSAVSVSINKVTPTVLTFNFTNMNGKTLPVPLNVPNAGAVGEAVLKGVLAAVLGKIVPNLIGKALSAELAGINVATQITMTNLDATMDTSVDLTVCRRVPDYERHFPWLWRTATGTTHLETTNESVSVTIPAGSVNLTAAPWVAPGIIVNDTLDIGKAIDQLETQIRGTFNNINPPIQKQIQQQYPNATITPLPK